MAFDEGLAERLRDELREHHDIAEKRMFGGLAFMLRGHMCVGILRDTLVVRVGAERYEDALRTAHARPMDFTGRPLTGFVMVEPPGFESDADLSRWVHRALRFNALLPPK
ncbi:TfoX/Sxy family protein [Aromatoleum evansii]|uniref:TfoX/Sxy family protein n=1 Tax=Aromatoleum evansii TaxID=59406 RepID=UPI00145CDEE4|nr:TfoX/Sxy family protein [Aromatoleum evansii]NMG27939.1 RNA methyltransferase [Aromatoleum evansii]